MNIEIHQPELENRLRQQIQSGQFHDMDELLTKALDALDHKTMPRPKLAALRKKRFLELCDPVRGRAEDIDFSRNPSPFMAAEAEKEISGPRIVASTGDTVSRSISERPYFHDWISGLLVAHDRAVRLLPRRPSKISETGANSPPGERRRPDGHSLGSSQ